MSRVRGICRFLGSAALAISLSAVLLVSAALAQDRTFHFDLPEQSLSQTLRDFGRLASQEIIFTEDLVTGTKSKALRGDFTAADALARLLKGTNLTSERSASGALMIRRQDKPAAPKTSQATSDIAPGATGLAAGDTAAPQTVAGTTPPPATFAVPEILVKGAKTFDVDITRTQNDVQAYTIFSSTQIEQSGATDVEDFLKQQLTMNTTVQTNTQAHPSQNNGTTSSINLRGLGANETLILVDGRRSAGVSIQGTTNQPDINGIPLGAIERIEVLPASASAIYGGAAVGGVVNIILKRKFDGGDVSYSYDNPANGNAPIRSINGSYGASFADGRTQIMLAGHYGDGSPLYARDRLNLVGRGIATILVNDPSYFSSTFSPFPGATPNIASTSINQPLTLKNGGTPLNSLLTYVAPGTRPGTDPSTGLLADAGAYNLNLSPGAGFYGLGTPFGTVPLTKSLLGTIRQTVADDIQLFTEISTSSNEGRAIYSPFAGSYRIPSTAPTNPFQQRVTVVFPTTVTAPQTSDSVTQSATVGLVVPLSHSWSSELDYTWSRNSFEDSFDYADHTALNSALGAGTVNPFVDTIAYPLALSPYLAPQAFSGDSTLDDFALRASGPIGTLLAGHPTLTVGLEHRKEGSHNANVSGDYPLTPSNTSQEALFGQSQSTDSFYAEGLVPLVASQNEVPGVHSLDLQVAGRSERYSVFTGTLYAYLSPPDYVSGNPPQGVHDTIRYTSTNFTTGLRYQPIADVVVRASYATAFLPPTANQLVANPTLECGFPCVAIVDPKNGQAYDVDFSSGGNPKLRPQTSKDLSLGLIWDPQQDSLRGLRMDLEYYRITQPNYITTPTVQQLVSDPTFASHVTRDPTTGLVTFVDDSPVNAIEYKTSGWDLKLDYRKSTTFGIIGAHAAGTLIAHDLRQYGIDSPFLEYAGFTNDGGEVKLKANATLSWEYRHLSLAWTTTYYAKYEQSYAPGGPSYAQFGPNPFYTDAQGGYTIPSQMYHDIYASYVVEQGRSDTLLSNLTIQFGIKNVFNKLPPFDAFAGPYFYSPYGDPRLRDYRLGVRKSF